MAKAETPFRDPHVTQPSRILGEMMMMRLLDLHVRVFDVTAPSFELGVSTGLLIPWSAIF
jgi:hypothetical protein